MLIRRRRGVLGIVGWLSVGSRFKCDSAQQLHKLSAAGISQKNSTIVISDDVGAAKPPPAIFKQCLLQLEVNPIAALYVGDDSAKDMVGASSAGMREILIDRNAKECLLEHPQVTVVQSLRKVIDVLAK